MQTGSFGSITGGSKQGYLDTIDISGSRFAYLPSEMFTPGNFYGTTNPSALAVLSIPPTYNQLGSTPQALTLGAVGAAHPLHPKFSITPWTVGGLIVAALALHWLYYREVKRGPKSEPAAA